MQNIQNLYTKYETSKIEKKVLTNLQNKRWFAATFCKLGTFFEFYLPQAKYGTIIAAEWSIDEKLKAVSLKWLAESHKILIDCRCSFPSCFLRQILFFLILLSYDQGPSTVSWEKNH